MFPLLWGAHPSLEPSEQLRDSGAVFLTTGQERICSRRAVAQDDLHVDLAILIGEVQSLARQLYIHPRLIGYLLGVGTQALHGLDAQSTHAQNDRDQRQEHDHEAYADISVTHFEYLQEVPK